MTNEVVSFLPGSMKTIILLRWQPASLGLDPPRVKSTLLYTPPKIPGRGLLVCSMWTQYSWKYNHQVTVECWGLSRQSVLLRPRSAAWKAISLSHSHLSAHVLPHPETQTSPISPPPWPGYSCIPWFHWLLMIYSLVSDYMTVIWKIANLSSTPG